VAGEEAAGAPAPHKGLGTAAPPRPSLLPYGAALAMVAGALGLGLVLQSSLGHESTDLVFLTAVVAVAVRFGLGPSLAAVLASSLAYNFFFLPPLYTFTIADPTNVVALFFFTLVAVAVSNLAARVRAEARIAGARSRTTEALYGFSRKLAGCGTLDDVLWATAYQIALMLRLRVVLLLPQDGPAPRRGAVTVMAGYPPEDFLDEADLAAATWTFDHGRPAGRGADTLPGAKRLFLPLRTGRGMVGVVGLDGDKPGPLLTPDQRRLLDALADQAALAIERVHLVEDLDRARRSAEADRLRQALLSSLSHDLKTPLAAVLGAATTLRDLRDALGPEAKGELLATMIDEAERLNRFIANLLDMTKLESGALAPNLAPHDLAEIVGTALERAGKILSRHRVELALGAGLPALRLDAVLMEQVLFNLLDNAAKYAPEGSLVRIEAWQETRREGDAVSLTILDEGEGIPEGDEERIFDTFYRVRKSDRVRAGTGLGLAISRGFVEAMGGRITARNRGDRPDSASPGAAFTLILPVPRTALEDAA
ncbi:DUF4118 domain-containing protein, partial [Methylobacterium aquaticum]